MTPLDVALVPPDAVRVWRGFRSPSLALPDFYSKLGTVFVPATVKMQIQAGLSSYIPTIPGGVEGKPDTVPDETAILFWESQATYWNGFTRLAVRTYTLTHGSVYDAGSRADFPVLFAGALTKDAPVFLFDQPADWMRGAVRHFLGARPAGQDAVAFRATVASALTQIQKTLKLGGAVASVSDDAVVYWELGPAAPGVQTPPSGIPLVRETAAWNQAFSPAATYLPVGLWDEWAGMDVRAGSSFNMQFERARS
jgi:hypothetical protein